MRMKRKDTQLLVENWRRLINEDATEKVPESLTNGELGSHLKNHIQANQKEKVMQSTPENLDDFLVLMCNYLRSDEEIENFAETCKSENLKSALNYVIKQAPSAISQNKNWPVAGQIAPMLR